MDGVAEACELYRDGFWGQRASSVSSLAFIAAAVAIAAQSKRRTAAPAQVNVYALLVAAVGVGSVIQHGPDPQWQAFAHDLAMAALLAFVAADAAGDLFERRLAVWWWVVPTVVMAPIVALGWLASVIAQVVLAAAAIGLSLLRARVRPALRSRLLTGLAILGVGGLIGSLAERTSLCQPETLVQGHAVWHVLAAFALWWIWPVVGSGRVRSLHG
jgi:hypothetical protein